MVINSHRQQGFEPNSSVIEWLLENQHPGTMAIDMEEREDQPSRWKTLRALRVLKWYSARD